MLLMLFAVCEALLVNLRIHAREPPRDKPMLVLSCKYCSSWYTVPMLKDLEVVAHKSVPHDHGLGWRIGGVKGDETGSRTLKLELAQYREVAAFA